MAFTTGMQALKGAIKENADKAAAREEQDENYKPMPSYYSWKVGDKKILRMLTDDIMTEDFYQNIVCADGKQRSFLVNPDDPDMLSRYMSETPGIGWKKEYGTGDLIEPYKQRQTVGIAVEREEVLVNGQLVVQNKEITRKIGEKEFTGYFFGIIQQALSNFWEPLTSQIYERYHSTCTLDIEVARTGTAKNTNYGFMPLREVPDLSTIEAVQQTYFYGWEFNKEDPDRFKKCPATLLQWAEYYSSEDRYRRLLLPKDQAGATPTGGSGLNEFSRDTTSNPDEAQATSGTFASLREDLARNAQNAQK